MAAITPKKLSQLVVSPGSSCHKPAASTRQELSQVRSCHKLSSCYKSAAVTSQYCNKSVAVTSQQMSQVSRRQKSVAVTSLYVITSPHLFKSTAARVSSVKKSGTVTAISCHESAAVTCLLLSLGSCDHIRAVQKEINPDPSGCKKGC